MKANEYFEKSAWVSAPPDPSQVELYFEVAEGTDLTVEAVKSSLRKLIEQTDGESLDLMESHLVAKRSPIVISCKPITPPPNAIPVDRPSPKSIPLPIPKPEPETETETEITPLPETEPVANCQDVNAHGK